MYCGTCLLDNILAAKLIQLGHDVSLIPTYTPIRTDDQDVSLDRVFYGAINVYLEQHSALFRHTPWLVDRLLNSKRLLAWASRKGDTADFRGLGPLTLSILQGEHGLQRKELDRLATWLEKEVRPDLVHLTNSLFLGLARELRSRLDVPVLCSLQGEDLFIDNLDPEYRERVRAALRERTADADGFIASSRYYAEFMQDYLSLSAERIHHVDLGLNLEGFGTGSPEKDERPFIIGYLARIAPEKGLHLLVDAFHQLVQRTEGAEQLRLRIAGYLGARDQEYLDGIMAQVKSWGLDGIVDNLGEVDRNQKISFLDTLHVLAVPTIYEEPKGLYALEALASGVPAVLPGHGAFPEMIERTGGGLLTEPRSATALADALHQLMHDAKTREELGRRGKEAVHRDYNDTAMARRTVEIYTSYLRR